MSSSFTVTRSKPAWARRREEIGSAQWAAALQADSHDPEMRRIIRHAIRDGLVRVRPMPDDPNRVLVRTVGS
jgi:hypothetical protein